MSDLILILVVSGCNGFPRGVGLSGFPKLAILMYEIYSNLNCLSNRFEKVSARLVSSIGYSVTRSSNVRKEMGKFLFEISC